MLKGSGPFLKRRFFFPGYPVVEVVKDIQDSKNYEGGYCGKYLAKRLEFEKVWHLSLLSPLI
ncbi:MAG: hypothetical protein A2913_01105 [Parcubacteria group bacterium RIFCSPLOWO2_01_FULL_40_65]|nr:MAG: hypothetical protein A3D40_02470 [Parcubacteria group bacterium RIFCSPHIGHO2_02_FULL_40_12]OHB22085.1 MAG: hypothetical protein A2913_01105 [Parcubacteria group bacterium RIFCSPLOWO2_01_FULL_40_65]